MSAVDTVGNAGHLYIVFISSFLGIMSYRRSTFAYSGSQTDSPIAQAGMDFLGSTGYWNHRCALQHEF